MFDDHVVILLPTLPLVVKRGQSLMTTWPTVNDHVIYGCPLAQHAVQGKLTGADTAMARWLVFAYTHHDLPLDFKVFVPTLEKLQHTLLNNLFHQEEETRFLEVAAMFIQNCVEYIRKHRHFLDSEPEKHTVQLEYVLK